MNVCLLLYAPPYAQLNDANCAVVAETLPRGDLVTLTEMEEEREEVEDLVLARPSQVPRCSLVA